MDMVATTEGGQINIQALSRLSQRLLTLATKGFNTESKFAYLLKATKIMEDEIETLNEEDDVQFQFQNEVNTSTNITNGVMHGEQNNNTIENPEKRRNKGRGKKRKRIPTKVEATKEKARKKRAAAAAAAKKKKKAQIEPGEDQGRQRVQD